jgi:hypothetical protein
MKNKRLYLLCLVGTMLLTLTRTSASVQAATPQPPHDKPFQFAQPDGVELAWEDIKKGEAVVQVLNNTTTARTLTVTLSKMGFKALDETKLDNDMALEPWSEPITLPAGGDVSIPFAIKDARSLFPGAYSGFLHVSESDTNTTIHLPITIEVTAAPLASTSQAGEAPVPLVDTWTVYYVRRQIPGLEWLWESRNMFFPLDIDGNKGPAVALDSDKPLGYLTSDVEGVATVSWIVPAQVQSNNKYGIQLAFDGLDHAKKYSGKINLLPDDKEDKGIVNLTVQVTDFILWPTLVILLGLLAAVFGQHLAKVVRYILLLHLDEADTKKPEPFTAYKYSIVDYDDQRKKIREAITALWKKYRLSTAVLGTDNDEYKKIVDDLKKLDEQVQMWEKFEGELGTLKGALSKFAEDFEEKFGEPSKLFPNAESSGAIPLSELLPHTIKDGKITKPVFEGEASALLTKPAPLVFGTPSPETEGRELLKTRQDKVTQAATLAQSWIGWAERLLKAKAFLKALEPDCVMSKSTKQVEQTKPDCITSELPEQVQQARFELARVETWLWETLTLDALKGVEMEKSLCTAESLIAGFKKYPCEDIESEDKKFAEAPVDDSGREAVEEPIDVGLLSVIPYFPDKLPTEDTERLRVIQRTLRRGDWLVFVFALVAGLYGGLNELYLGKMFGTPWDYVKAFAWGLGTKAVLEVIYAAINKLARVAD